MSEELELASDVLGDLARRISTEHQDVERSISNAVAHAIQAGLLLLEVREIVGQQEWPKWIERNLPLSTYMAKTYVRLAVYRDQIEPCHLSPSAAVRSIAGLPEIEHGGQWARRPDEEKEEARRLYAQGETKKSIAAMFGVAETTAASWVDPDVANRRRDRKRQAHKRARAIRKALEEQRKREERERLAHQRGGNLGKAYDLVRKLHPIVDAAISEGLTLEARALAVRLEDEIFKALKGGGAS